MHTYPTLALGALALALSLTLAGCGDKKGGDKATQVVAKVNKDEITVHQLNAELAGLGNLSPEQSKQAARQVVKSMVDQQLLVQQAIEDKLDRDPQVMQNLEAMRRKLLAQAYVQKLTANTPAPTEAQVGEYYGKHPELFAERRIYRLQEINVQVTPANVETVKAQLAKTKNLGDFIQWLKAQNIPARAGQSTKTAEQLPLELLPRLHQLKNGQALTLAGPGVLNIVVVADSQTQPMSQEQAKPVIERFLANAKKREMAEASLKSLREKAKIEYLGDYADAGKTAEAPVSAPAPVAKESAAAPAQTPAADAHAIEKGVTGLK